MTTQQPELPGMPERPAEPPTETIVVLLAVTVDYFGHAENTVRDLMGVALYEHVREVVNGWESAGDDPRRWVGNVRTGSEVLARYGSPGAYERARERAWASAVLAEPVEQGGTR